jgi:hypothetical protein
LDQTADRTLASIEPHSGASLSLQNSGRPPRRRPRFLYALAALGALALIALFIGGTALHWSHRHALIQRSTGNSFAESGIGTADWNAFTDYNDRARIIVISAGDLRRLPPGHQSIDFRGGWSVAWHDDTGDEVRIFGQPIAPAEVPLLVVHTESRRDVRRHLTDAEAQQIYRQLKAIKTLQEMLPYADAQLTAADRRSPAAAAP